MTPEVADHYACTEVIYKVTPDIPIVSNLGTSSFILMDIGVKPTTFCMTSGMGTTTPIGFGLATTTDEPVTVLDGDGSLLMSLGCLATVGTYDPSNLTIVVWNNAVFETTGGQATLADAVDFVGIAERCGLEGWRATSTEAFREAYTAAVDHDGAALVEAVVESERPPDHPPLDYGHSYMKGRFREAVKDR